MTKIKYNDYDKLKSRQVQSFGDSKQNITELWSIAILTFILWLPDKYSLAVRERSPYGG